MCREYRKHKNEKQKKNPASSSGESKAQSSFPRTIKHLQGETVIEEKPVKIATPYISFVGYLAVLDEYPIAGQGIAIIERNFPYMSKMIEGKEIMDLGQEVDIEKLLASEPDIIIALTIWQINMIHYRKLRLQSKTTKYMIWKTLRCQGRWH